MKKLLLVSTAIAGVALMSAPASAAVKLDLGGFFRGYGVYTDNNEAAAASVHSFELRRDTEVHVNGETTLDNGLTVGFHTEQKLGGATTTDEAYAYFSSGMGRINLGSEDGAAYLLQVAAPSADSNVDGLRTYIQAINPQDAGGVFGAAVAGLGGSAAFDYDQVSDPTGATNTERVTVLSPKFSGFQFGGSYAPTVGQQPTGSGVFAMTTDLTGYDNVWDAAARWDGEFQGFGLSLGAGYSDSGQNNAAPAIGTSEFAAPTTVDGLRQWNAGANVTFSGFTLGGAYLQGDTEQADAIEVGAQTGAASTAVRTIDAQQDTWVVGLGYDNGPYHLGASYLNMKRERDASGVVGTDDGALAALDADMHRFSVGGGYTFGPGMTFRGAVSWGEFDNSTAASDAGQAGGFVGAAAGNNDFTQITLGTDIQF